MSLTAVLLILGGWVVVSVLCSSIFGLVMSRGSIADDRDAVGELASAAHPIARVGQAHKAA
jgi:hypothetical protein